MQTFKCAGGYKIPQIGFGPGIVGYSAKMSKQRSRLVSFLLRRYKRLAISHYYRDRHYVNAISQALEMGYRLLDYSAAYKNEHLIGQAIRKSGVNRGDLFITTRVSNKAQSNHYVREEFFQGLKKMGLEYVDLLQFHWPVTGYFLDTWREMEKLYEEGYVKHLGVANCHQHHIEEILKICKYRPEVAQFEIHPLFSQKPLIEYYQSQGIQVEAYTPIARYDDRLVRLPLIHQIAKRYNKTFVQVILRWHIQNGVIPLVRSMSLRHQQENLDVFDFELSAEDMSLIDGININSRLRYDPDNCDFNIL
jgi:diketogulonate reductase-like aldo/keto reductase